MVLLLAPAVVVAQGLSTRLSHVDTSEFPRIGAVLTVFSADGNPVCGLTADDFSLDEGGTPVAVVSVALEKAPLQIALVLDTSGSMKSAMPELKAAVGQFLRSHGDTDRVLLVTFADRAQSRVDFTADRRRLMDKLDALGATALFDGIHLALQESRSVSGRRLAVMKTNGTYDPSRHSKDANTAPATSWTPSSGAAQGSSLLFIDG